MKRDTNPTIPTSYLGGIPRSGDQENNDQSLPVAVNEAKAIKTAMSLTNDRIRLERIYDNMDLFFYISSIHHATLYVDASLAVTDYVHPETGTIMLYIPLLDMYVRIHKAQLNICSEVLLRYNIVVYQLISNADMHGFVFICSDIKQKSMVSSIIRTYLGNNHVPISFTGNQVYVQLAPTVHINARMDDFLTFVCNNAFCEVQEAIHRINPVTIYGVEFIRCQCLDINGLHPRM